RVSSPDAPDLRTGRASEGGNRQAFQRRADGSSRQHRQTCLQARAPVHQGCCDGLSGNQVVLLCVSRLDLRETQSKTARYLDSSISQGNLSVNVEPLPTILSTRIRPLCCSTI